MEHEYDQRTYDTESELMFDPYQGYGRYERLDTNFWLWILLVMAIIAGGFALLCAIRASQRNFSANGQRPTLLVEQQMTGCSSPSMRIHGRCF